MTKERTDLYAGGLLQQNLFSHLASKKKLIGNSAYLKSMISDKSSLLQPSFPTEKSKRIGVNIKKRKDETMNMIDAVQLTSKSNGITYLFLSDATNNTTVSGVNFFDAFKVYKLDENINYQQFFVKDDNIKYVKSSRLR